MIPRTKSKSARVYDDGDPAFAVIPCNCDTINGRKFCIVCDSKPTFPIDKKILESAMKKMDCSEHSGRVSLAIAIRCAGMKDFNQAEKQFLRFLDENDVHSESARVFNHSVMRMTKFNELDIDLQKIREWFFWRPASKEFWRYSRKWERLMATEKIPIPGILRKIAKPAATIKIRDDEI